ncbi:hypothetical protein BD309DRAFT_859198, partial [Dichomitus squalens]
RGQCLLAHGDRAVLDDPIVVSDTGSPGGEKRSEAGGASTDISPSRGGNFTNNIRMPRGSQGHRRSAKPGRQVAGVFEDAACCGCIYGTCTPMHTLASPECEVSCVIPAIQPRGQSYRLRHDLAGGLTA